MAKKRKIKVFLSGIVNSTNAQNLNCLALAKHLDKSKFEVRTLVLDSGNLPVEKIEGVECLRIRYPFRIWHPMQLARGILWSDVAYLCKPENWKLQRWLVRAIGRKSFKTIEGVFAGTNLEKAVAAYGSRENVSKALSFTTRTYSITNAMRTPNRAAVGVETEARTLYLGVEAQEFSNGEPRRSLSDVAIIGGNLYYKGLDDFFALAARFPALRFHVVGSGLGKVSPREEADKAGLSNVVCHGTLTHGALAELLKTVQLHIFPSRAEGFPKVTLETAAAGVPSVVYGDYGADEWISTGKDGFVVKTLDEMADVVRDLVGHPEKLQPLADGARAMAARFDWRRLVKDWEAVIIDLAEARG